MGKLLLIVNPTAGKGKIRENLLDIVGIFTGEGWRTEVYVTRFRHDAARVAEERGEEMDLLVCSGGDGTLSETIAGLMKLRRPPRLAYIPSGSTNDLASSLGLPKKMTSAALNALRGETMRIDIGRFGGERTFVYVAGFGAFTEVSYETPQQTKNLMGHQAYMLESVKGLANIKSYHMTVESDEFNAEGDFLLGLVTNALWVGGFQGLVPKGVALNDGLFEVLLIRTPKTAVEMTSVLSSVFTGGEYKEYVHRFTTSKLRVSCGEPVNWVLDGEFGGGHRDVEIEALRERIEIVAGKTAENGKKD